MLVLLLHATSLPSFPGGHVVNILQDGPQIKWTWRRKFSLANGPEAKRQGEASEALKLEKYLDLGYATSHFCDPCKDLPSLVLSFLIYKMEIIMIVFTF